MNPYGRPMEPYPSIMEMPPEGGSINLSFESNFDFKCSLNNPYESGFQLNEMLHEYRDYYRRLDLTITAEQNNTGKDLNDTLWVYYLYPTLLLPIRAEGKIGDYIIRQHPL